MQDSLNVGAEVLGVIALLLNAVVLHKLADTYRKKIGSKAPYLIITIMNIFHSSLYALSVPRSVTHNHCIVYIATGIVSSYTTGLLLLLCNYIAMLVYLLTIFNSFLYKYVVFCRPSYRFIYHSTWAIVPIFANFLIIVNWMGGVVFQLNREELDEDELQKLSATASLANADIKKHSFLGFCTEDENSWSQYPFLIENSMATLVLFVISLYLAHRVKKRLKEPSLSRRTQQLQRRISNMLLAQALNLGVLLPAPLLLHPLYLMCGLTSPIAVVFIPTIAISAFHVVNPTIAIVLLRNVPSSVTKVAQSTSVFVLQTDWNTLH